MHAKSTHSSFRDRTNEFHSITETFKKTLPESNEPTTTSTTTSFSSSSRSEQHQSSIAIQSEFNRRASKIGYGIHQTSQKLSKLAKLAKRTSVFDDPTVEIQELTSIIKQDITALNSAVVDLQLVSNSRNDSTDTTSHSTTVVDDLKTRLMTTTKEFKDVLTMRTEDSANPFLRQRPLATRPATTGSTSNAPAPPWASESSSSSQLLHNLAWLGKTGGLMELGRAIEKFAG
ncbi:hypothetical protein TSUD_306660 [Trifolium subterraneum]|uniref:Syntaxin-5 N-terminal Sly1p-binding domain-containing protein n=1 Tax=Trifolium subterraneum TaxID=3900 RepID=A0A2Z6PH73_TRISU|nr:hypothetical protein TSUD_306660 [Trifolium subterraneum]